MKKIIKLTEAELNRIIKKVIEEQTYRTGNLDNPEDFLPKKEPISTATPTAPKTIFGRGDSGPEVLAFQKQLVALGYNVGKKGADGVFGPATEAAVKDFQGKYGIKVSGRVGNPTRRKLATVASAPKPSFDPTAEWNQDRREDGNVQTPPAPQTPIANTPTEPPLNNIKGVSPLVSNSPIGKAISKIGPNVRAKREAEKAAQAELKKQYPNAGYGGGGGWLSKKLSKG